MKGILLATVVALVVVVALLFMQSRNEDEAAPVAAASAPAETESVSAATEAAEPASEPVAEPAAAVAMPEASEVQYSEGMANFTAEGREISTMNKEEVLSALDGGAEQVLGMRQELQALEAAGDTAAYEALKAKHDQMEREMLDLANRGVSIQKGN